MESELIVKNINNPDISHTNPDLEANDLTDDAKAQMVNEFKNPHLDFKGATYMSKMEENNKHIINSKGEQKNNIDNKDKENIIKNRSCPHITNKNFLIHFSSNKNIEPLYNSAILLNCKHGNICNNSINNNSMDNDYKNSCTNRFDNIGSINKIVENLNIKECKINNGGSSVNMEVKDIEKYLENSINFNELSINNKNMPINEGILEPKSNLELTPKDSKQIQNELLEMGYEFKFINNLIKHLEIHTTEQAVEYASKLDYRWNHPFICQEILDIENISNNNILEITDSLKCAICEDILANHYFNTINNMILNKNYRYMKNEINIEEKNYDFHNSTSNKTSIHDNQISNNLININNEKPGDVKKFKKDLIHDIQDLQDLHSLDIISVKKEKFPRQKMFPDLVNNVTINNNNSGNTSEFLNNTVNLLMETSKKDELAERLGFNKIKDLHKIKFIDYIKENNANIQLQVLNPNHIMLEQSNRAHKNEDIVLKDNKPNKPIRECEICLGEVSKEFTLDCHHYFCKDCLTNYVNDKINNSEIKTIACPRGKEKCSYLFSEDILQKLVSKQYMDRYYKFRRRAEICNIKGVILCPIPDCESFAIIDKEELNINFKFYNTKDKEVKSQPQKNQSTLQQFIEKYEKYINNHSYFETILNPNLGNPKDIKSINNYHDSNMIDLAKNPIFNQAKIKEILFNLEKNNCGSCFDNFHTFCLKCKHSAHVGKNCEKGIDCEFSKFVNQSNHYVKKCPKCGFFIQKNHGCNHMTCANAECKYEFCWICMGKYKQGHYNNILSRCFKMQNTKQDSLIINHSWLAYPRWFLLLIFIIIFFCVSFVFGPVIALVFIGSQMSKGSFYCNHINDRTLRKFVSFLYYVFYAFLGIGLYPIYFYFMSLTPIILIGYGIKRCLKSY